MVQESMILERKLSPPRIPANRVRRENLIGELKDTVREEDPYPQIILFTSPAGYGKTTAAAQWIQQEKAPGVWYNIDERDDDFQRFFTYLIHALGKVYRDVGKASLDMLSRYNVLAEGSFTFEGILTPLLNELHGKSSSCYLLLDHYHHIGDPEVHRAMGFFLENLPENIKPVILSRREPPWPVHQWRSKRRLLEVQQDKLAFSPEETETFLREAAGLNLSPGDRNTLWERTEGWVTALQLVIGSLGGGTTLEQVISGLTGDHQQILHYLSEETLNRQPKKIREFLMATGGLPRFSPALTDSLLDREDSQEIIETLLRENLFLVPLDQQGKWFRYHSLFREILLRHQSREGKKLPGDFYRRGARWFEDQGDPGEAVDLYLKAGDYQGAAEVLSYRTDYLWETEGFNRFLHWLERIPEEIRRNSLRLTVYYGFMHLFIGNMEETQRCFIQAEAINDDSDREALGILETLRTTFHLFNSDLEAGMASAKKALAYLPEDAYFWRISGAVVLGDVTVFSGDLSGAYEIYREAYRWSLRSGNSLSTVTVVMNLLKVLWIKGDLYQARRFAQESLEAAKKGGYAGLPRVGVYWTFLGEYLREGGDLEEGIRCANRGLVLGESEGVLYAMLMVFMAGQCLSQKTYDEGLEYLYRLEDMKREAPLPEMIEGLMHSWKARLFIAKGEVERAREELENSNLQDVTGIFFPGSPPLVNIRLLLLENRTLQGEEAIEALKELPQHDVSRRLMMEVLLLEAHLMELRGQNREAEDRVLKALRLGKGYGYYQIYLEEGAFVAPVFQRLLDPRHRSGALKKDPGFTEFLQTVAGELQTEEKRSAPDNEPSAPSPSTTDYLVEELTEREVEILQAIARGLTNGDISNTMHLSVHTVKWHNKNIFGKLGVGSRTQAVIRGRELGLIH